MFSKVDTNFRKFTLRLFIVGRCMSSFNPQSLVFVNDFAALDKLSEGPLEEILVMGLRSERHAENNMQKTTAAVQEDRRSHAGAYGPFLWSFCKFL